MSGSKTQICPAIDTVGPLGLSVDVVARLFAVMAFYDDSDVNSVRHTWDNYLATLGHGVKGLSLGLPEAYFFDDLGPGVSHGRSRAGRVPAGAERRPFSAGAPRWPARTRPRPCPEDFSPRRIIPTLG